MKYKICPLYRGCKSIITSAIAILLIGSTQAKIWTSADGSKTFEGELVSYDDKTGSVKVALNSGKNITFNRKKLSKSDIKFLADSVKKESVKKTKTPVSKPAKKEKTLPKKNKPNSKPSKKTKVEEQKFAKPITFHPYPKLNDKKPWNVRNFGPVGIEINITKPNLTMVIANVEEGSPAHTVGKLKKGQIIESINNQTLHGKDPREILGDIITNAEATDGKISLKIKDVGNVLVSVPVMGSYSKTWPLDCPKSDKIVRKLADYLAKQEKPGWGAVLFMLSTGEDKDLQIVRKWMTGIKTIGSMNWEKGFKGHGLCEYYLRTGDKSVLPVIKKMTEELKGNMYRGSWSGRGGPAHFGYGPLHAAGAPCATFLVMAKLCGVEVDEHMFSTVMKQFYRYAGHGNVSYGDQFPEGGFRDNGKTGALALTMAAATLLTPEGEESVYAKARDNSAMKSFYATNWFHAAHTGGGIGEIWHHKAINLVREKRPKQYRSYLDTRRWVMELSRKFDGTIGIAGMTDRYDLSASDGGISWGTHFALTYTLPRKHLQMFGAPRSKWAKHQKLPARFWGNAADDIFQSMDPAKHSSISMEDILAETVPNDASLPASLRYNAPNVSDETLLKYLHHPEFGLRVSAMRSVVKNKRDHLVLPMLKSDDPRLRYNGILAITGMYKGSSLPDDKITPEMFKLIGDIIENPNESWWVLQGAVKALAKADKAFIVKHMDRLVELLNSESTFIKQVTIKTLSTIATDPDHYKKVFPLVVSNALDGREWGAAYGIYNSLTKELKNAKPEVKAFAGPILKKVYDGIPNDYVFKGGTVLKDGPGTHRKLVAKTMGVLPGNLDFILKIPKKTAKYMLSNNEKDRYIYSGNFTPDKTMQGTWRILYFGKRPAFEKTPEIESETQKWIKNWRVKGSKPLSSNYGFIFSDGGGVKTLGYTGRLYGDHFWTKGMLIGKYTDHALRVKMGSFEGIDYMIVPHPLEVEDLTISGEEEEKWTPKYSAYVKESSEMQFVGKKKKKKKK